MIECLDLSQATSLGTLEETLDLVEKATLLTGRNLIGFTAE